MKKVLLMMPDALEKPMGGMGEQARQLLKAFDNNGNDFLFRVVGSSTQEHTVGSNYVYQPFADIDFPNPNLAQSTKVLMAQTGFLRSALGGPKPDIVHAFDWSTFLAGIHASQHFKVPLVTTVQLSVIHMIRDLTGDVGDDSEGTMAMRRGDETLEIMGLMHSNKIIQVSKAYARKFSSIFLPKTEIIGNGINMSEWKPKEKIKLPGTRPIKVVYIGRFDYMKNVQALFRLDLPKEIDLIFIGGTNGGRAELLDQVATLNKEGFHYVGPKYGQEKVDWLFAADAVVVPSLHEPFGIVALEGLASKSILLSSFVDGMGDFLDESFALNCGISKSTIEMALTKLVRMSNAEKTWRVEKGLQRCQEYAWETQAQKLEKVYLELLGQTNQ